MRPSRLILWLALTALVLAVPTFAGDDADISTMAKTWMDAFNAGDDAGVVALYAEDGCRMPPNAATVTGGEAIAANIAGSRQMGAAKLELSVTMSSASGTEGHGMGTYVLFDGEGHEIDSGKWMNIVKKVGENWRIACDIWNSDLPLPMGDGG